MTGGTAAGGQMRARPADIVGYVDRDGVKIGYEVSGAGPDTILLRSKLAKSCVDSAE
jgi:hypothetical protein